MQYIHILTTLVLIALALICCGCSSPQYFPENNIPDAFSTYLEEIADSTATLLPRPVDIHLKGSYLYYVRIDNTTRERHLVLHPLYGNGRTEHIALRDEGNSGYFDVYKNNAAYFITPSTGVLSSLDLRTQITRHIATILYGGRITIIDTAGYAIVEGIPGITIIDLRTGNIKGAISHTERVPYNAAIDFDVRHPLLFIGGVLDSTGPQLQCYHPDNLEEPVWSTRIRNKYTTRLIVQDSLLYAATVPFNGDGHGVIYRVLSASGTIADSITESAYIHDMMVSGDTIVYVTPSAVGCSLMSAHKNIWRFEGYNIQTAMEFRGRIIVLYSKGNEENSRITVLSKETGQVQKEFDVEHSIEKVSDRYLYYNNTLYQ